MKNKGKVQKSNKPEKKAGGWEIAYWILLGLASLLVVVIRMRLLDVPFERDEGDYALNASLLLDGHTLSSPLLIKRFPLIYAIYELFFILFGRSDSAIRAGLLLINLASGWGVYLILKDIRGKESGLMAASFFLILSLLPQILGLSANREHFIIFFALFGFYILLKSEGKRDFLNATLAGLLLGLAFAVKQNALFWVLFGGIWLLLDFLLYQKKGWLHSVLSAFFYSIGAAIPFLIIFLTYWQLGVEDDFIAKSFASNANYVAALSWQDGVQNLTVNELAILKSSWMLHLFAILPILALFKKGCRNRGLIFAFLFFFFSFLSIVPGWYFRLHYFILMIPSVSMLSAIGLDLFKSFILRYQPALARWLIILPFVFIFQILLANRAYFFEANATEAARIAYGHNPFSESKKLGQYIARTTPDTARLMVLGSEPELYFYSKREPAISAYYMYFLMDGSETASEKQKKLMKEAEDNPPDIIIFVKVSSSWNKAKNADLSLLEWVDDFILKNKYQMDGVIDILPDKSRYIFGRDAIKYKIRSTGYLLVFKKGEK